MSKQRFASVWDAIENTPQQAASMRARSELMIALQRWVKVEGLSQAIAANVLGVTQPRVSDLMRGRINLFSLDTLIDMAATAGLAPHVTIKQQSKPAKKRAVEVIGTA
jgi:predicted XRE-type DNA-binding protein